MTPPDYTISHRPEGNQVYNLIDKPKNKITRNSKVYISTEDKKLSPNNRYILTPDKYPTQNNRRLVDTIDTNLQKREVKRYVPIKWEGIESNDTSVFLDRFPMGYYKGQRKPGYSIQRELLEALDTIKKSVLTQNNDFLFIIDGKVGLGKTTLSLQLALYLNPKFKLSQVCFTPKQLMDTIIKAPKGSAIILDEAMTLNARNSMTEWNKRVNDLLSRIRSHNLFIILNLPSAFDLDRSIILHRASLLIHCYSPTFGKKGYYKVYHEIEDRLKTLYLLGKKMYSYKKPQPNFEGWFSKCFVIDEVKYNRKKDDAIEDQEITPNHSAYKERNVLIRHLKDQGMSYEEISNLNPGGISGNAVGKICRYDRGRE